MTQVMLLWFKELKTKLQAFCKYLFCKERKH